MPQHLLDRKVACANLKPEPNQPAMLFAPCAFLPLGRFGYEDDRHSAHSEVDSRMVAGYAPWASEEGNSAAYTCFVEDHCRSSYGVCLRGNPGEAELTSGSLVSCRREHGPSNWVSVGVAVCCCRRPGPASLQLLSEEEAGEDGIQGYTGGELVVVEMKDDVVGGLA